MMIRLQLQVPDPNVFVKFLIYKTGVQWVSIYNQPGAPFEIGLENDEVPTVLSFFDVPVMTSDQLDEYKTYDEESKTENKTGYYELPDNTGQMKHLDFEEIDW